MAKVKKTYRFDQETLDILEKLAGEKDMSATAIIEDAVRSYGQGKDESQTLKDITQALLNAQTLQANAEKKLEEANQELKMLRAGRSESEVEVEAAVEPIEKQTRWQRLWRAWKG